MESYCVVRIEDRALPICFVQDKRTVSRLFMYSVFGPYLAGPRPPDVREIALYARDIINSVHIIFSLPLFDNPTDPSHLISRDGLREYSLENEILEK